MFIVREIYLYRQKLYCRLVLNETGHIDQRARRTNGRDETRTGWVLPARRDDALALSAVSKLKICTMVVIALQSSCGVMFHCEQDALEIAKCLHAKCLHAVINSPPKRPRWLLKKHQA